MAKQTVPDLKELFKQAAEIAQQVPESMQEAAFNRAVDLLTGTAEIPTRGESPEKRTKQGSRTSANTASKGAEPGQSLVEQIDSTQHPGVRSATKVLDRALMVLQIALSDHQVDGLAPSEIARILTEKFRINTSAAAVRMALGKAVDLVNRIPKGGGYIYRIMSPGDDYLAHLGEGAAVAKARQPVGKKRQRKESKRSAKSSYKATQAAAKETQAASGTKNRSSAKSKVAGGALGPKGAILELVTSGFFVSAKTGPEVQEHLKEKRGFNLGIDQLSLAMLRMVRDGVLERNRNEEGKYEYKQS